MRSRLAMTLSGTVRLSDDFQRRTVGRFRTFMEANSTVFRRYFGVELFSGSLNVNVIDRPLIHADLDAGSPIPSFVIPRSEFGLIDMPSYIGDGQAWESALRGDKFPEPIICWIFRRKGSRVPQGVIELLAKDALVRTFGLKNGDRVVIDVFSPVADYRS